jgi:hypothetical protein
MPKDQYELIGFDREATFKKIDEAIKNKKIIDACSDPTIKNSTIPHYWITFGDRKKVSFQISPSDVLIIFSNKKIERNIYIKARSYLRKDIIVATSWSIRKVSDNKRLIEDVIVDYKSHNYVVITLNDVANEVGVSPDKIKDYVYASANRHGIKIGDNQLIIR